MFKSVVLFLFLLANVHSAVWYALCLVQSILQNAFIAIKSSDTLPYLSYNVWHLCSIHTQQWFVLLYVLLSFPFVIDITITTTGSVCLSFEGPEGALFFCLFQHIHTAVNLNLHILTDSRCIPTPRLCPDPSSTVISQPLSCIYQSNAPAQQQWATFNLTL